MTVMAKFEGGYLDHAGFYAIKDQLTAALAAVIEEQLIAMGEDIKGISWFSSCAEEFVCAKYARAA